MIFPETSIDPHDFIPKVPSISNILKRNGFICEHRKGFTKIRHTINFIIAQSRDGSIIIILEGNHTSDGQIQEFKQRFIHIIGHTSLDLLPVTMNEFYCLKTDK